MKNEDPVDSELIQAGPAPARLWHFIRPMDSLACNSYVVSAGGLFLVIDPGADREQSRRIFELIRAQGTPSPPAVVLLFTHCHRDHIRAVRHWREKEIPFHVMAHRTGAAALGSGTGEHTLCYLFGEEAPRLDVSFSLSFSGKGEAFPDSCDLPLRIRTEKVLTPTGAAVAHKILCLEGGSRLEIYHSPGHSTDSLCMLLGDRLFSGDILYADRPGVAGIPGWSQPCHLKTLDMLDWLIRARGVALCCPGHGPVLAAEDALRIIGGARKNTSRMDKLFCLDSVRVDFLKGCAEAFVREAGLMLSGLGARLHLLAERLDALGERGLAEELRQGIDLDRMEGFIADFMDYAQSQKSVLRLELPMRAVGTVGKLGRVLRKASLPEGVAGVMLERIEWLLRDYISIMVGYDLRDYLSDADAGAILEEAAAAFAPFSWDTDDAAEAADEPRAFALLLARAMDFRPRLPRLEWGRGASPPRLRVRTDPHRLKLLFIDVLEQLAIRKAPRLRVGFESEGEACVVSFSPGGDSGFTLRESRRKYYAAMMELICGRFEWAGEGSACTLRFTMPKAAREGNPAGAAPRPAA